MVARPGTSKRLEWWTSTLLGPRADEWVGRVTLWAALIGFLVHLGLWMLADWNSWPIGRETVLLQSPLLALYTPFSILLAYEVYQLIRVIPDSFSAAMGKQFEVVTLIVVRESLVYLAGLSPEDVDSIGPWILPLLVKVGAFVTLLTVSLAIGLEGRKRPHPKTPSPGMLRYVAVKQAMSVVLLAAFVFMASISVITWFSNAVRGDDDVSASIFFGDFFTILVLADIFILLMSYQYTHRFSVLARNTGFVLSTVIMRIAIEAPVIVDSILFVVAAVVGFLVFWITNRLDADLEAVDESTSSPGRGPWAKTVRVGFEPTVTRRPRRFSRPVRSTAPPPHLVETPTAAFGLHNTGARPIHQA